MEIVIINHLYLKYIFYSFEILKKIFLNSFIIYMKIRNALYDDDTLFII